MRPVRPGDFKIGTWNIEGYTVSKQIELETIMRRTGIMIMCVQETWVSKSDVFVTESGFLVVLSGGVGDEEGEERAGVGFIVASAFRQSIVGFQQATARMASMKLRISGGKAAIFSAYTQWV